MYYICITHNTNRIEWTWRRVVNNTFDKKFMSDMRKILRFFLKPAINLTRDAAIKQYVNQLKNKNVAINLYTINLPDPPRVCLCFQSAATNGK